jgi:hypothetical protein
MLLVLVALNFPSGTRLAAGSVQFTENDLAVVRNINASGVVTASAQHITGITTLTSIVGTSLSITGISTIANFIMTPVGAGATVGGIGVVTYYGDGSGLININLICNLSSVVGVCLPMPKDQVLPLMLIEQVLLQM